MEERIEKIESKVNVLLVLVSILIVISLIILGNNSYSSNNRNSSSGDTASTSETENSSYDVSSFKEITPSEIAGFKKKETYVVYIGRSGCSWCSKMLPNLKQAQEEYKYTTQYIDLAKIIDFNTGSILDNNAYTILANLDTVESEKDVMNELGSTPMMLIIRDKKIIGSYVGYSDYETFAKVLEDNGLKK